MTKPSLAVLHQAINQAYLADEATAINDLLVSVDDYDAKTVRVSAESLVVAVKSQAHRQTIIQAFLQEYQLNSQEGLVLMRIAEALLRIPDSQTQDQFLQEKLTGADWQSHVQQSASLLVNLSTKALLYTSLFETYSEYTDQHWLPVFDQLLARLGAPVIRSAIKQAMQQLAQQFVYADTIHKAIKHCGQDRENRYSFDMLGEAALTSADADMYFQAYLGAITALSEQALSENIYANAGISVKLSALYPRYEPSQHVRAVAVLSEKLLILARTARSANISITVDAEESERLDMSLAIFADVFNHPDLIAWKGLGLAVQAYQKRALPVINWLAGLAESRGKMIPLRLVKGAYWDSEIKRAQENGLSSYPVFTHKSATDLSYLACAKLILSRPDVFYGQFASHNAHTITAVAQFAKQHSGYEYQRLHGMGERLYQEFMQQQHRRLPCRIYAPVGHYQQLLPYLVRRLLENGANTSFINQLDRPDISVAEIVQDPFETVKSAVKQSRIPLPQDLYGKRRINSHGLNLADLEQLAQVQEQLAGLTGRHWTACPLINGQACSGEQRLIANPWDNRLTVGSVEFAQSTDFVRAVDVASIAFTDWRLHAVDRRAIYLTQAADLLEQHRLELVALCVREGGRSIKDALAEVREAVDFCRYYAQSAVDLFDQAINLPGPTGEENQLVYYGRGVFVCISPWNFPIAIFTGQIVAALVAGNCVIAKPANQTALTGMRIVQLLHQAGIPQAVLQFLPADGNLISQYLLPDPRIAGIAFTGSTLTARAINRQLAEHHLDIIPLLAETGGQNVMIADSSALLEQLVQDVITSAFNSAGQRCSALRVLFIQQDIADKTITMLIGAMQELHIGDPGNYATDIGPVISQQALKPLQDHLDTFSQQAKLLFQLALPQSLSHGSFFPPTLLEIASLAQLPNEVFGPILHVIRFHAGELNEVIASINATGYGLTLGIHSRMDVTIAKIRQQAKVGNMYINRNMIGAVVGVQPFGGMGLSGTGPKAGGPNYLQRFVVEQTITNNTASIGGNTALLAQDLR